MQEEERDRLVLEEISFQLGRLKMQADAIDAALLSYLLEMAIAEAREQLGKPPAGAVR
jgi:hypothetical protein